MKTLIIAFMISMVLTFSFLKESKAQSDTLVINLKNNQIEKILISQIQKIQFENITAVEEPGNTPHIKGELSAKGNFPNPFAEQTSIEFEIVTLGNVDIIIYNNSGEQVQTLKCENCQAGKNILQWNCLDTHNNRVLSGNYFYEVRFNNEVQSKKMLLVK
jgi:flagellar hook assembly protein FlgD